MRKTIKIGMQVMTPMGSGEVVGKECFYEGTSRELLRHIVKLDDPSKWVCSGAGGHPAFFENDVKELEHAGN